MCYTDLADLPEPHGIELSEEETEILLKKARKIFLRREKEEAEYRRRELERALGIMV